MVAKVFEAVFRRDSEDFISISEIKNLKVKQNINLAQ